ATGAGPCSRRHSWRRGDCARAQRRLHHMNGIAPIAERLLGRADQLADELTAAIRPADPSYDADSLVPVDDLRTSVRNNIVYIFTRLAGGRQAPGLAPARATGRRRAEQGAPLPAILHSYRVAGTFLWA